MKFYFVMKQKRINFHELNESIENFKILSKNGLTDPN